MCILSLSINGFALLGFAKLPETWKMKERENNKGIATFILAEVPRLIYKPKSDNSSRRKLTGWNLENFFYLWLLWRISQQ